MFKSLFSKYITAFTAIIAVSFSDSGAGDILDGLQLLH